jgi:hypothetical protein
MLSLIRVNAFREYLEQRWNEGCHNASQLWHEIENRGYSGGRSMVANLVSTLEKMEPIRNLDRLRRSPGWHSRHRRRHGPG